MTKPGSLGPSNDDPSVPLDTQTDSAIPPYEGRKTEANTEEGSTYTDGVRTGGAVSPVTDPDMKSPEPAETPRGAVASPADEQPATDQHDGEADPGVGPSHVPGTGRGEGHS